MCYMPNLLNIPTNTGKGRGILTIYILHSLKKKPKSGYDLLTEIKEKTAGSWTPSKGTIYPLLKHLEEEALIKVKSVDKRSKHIFEITSEGKKSLKDIKKHGKKMEEKFVQFRKILAEVMGEKDTRVVDLLFEIRTISCSVEKAKRNDVIKILDNCLDKLKKIPNLKTNNGGEIQ